MVFCVSAQRLDVRAGWTDGRPAFFRSAEHSRRTALFKAAKRPSGGHFAVTRWDHVETERAAECLMRGPSDASNMHRSLVRHDMDSSYLTAARGGGDFRLPQCTPPSPPTPKTKEMQKCKFKAFVETLLESRKATQAAGDTF